MTAVTSIENISNTYSSTTIIAVVTSISIASFAILLAVCGTLMIITAIFKARTSKHESAVDEVHHPSDTPVAPVPIIYYESIFPMEFQEQNLELKENIAYGPLPVYYRKGMATDPVYVNVS